MTSTLLRFPRHCWLALLTALIVLFAPGATFAQASARAFHTIMTDAMARLMRAMPKALERANDAARI